MISSALTSSAAHMGTPKAASAAQRPRAACAAQRTVTRIFPLIHQTNSLPKRFLGTQQVLGNGQKLNIARPLVDTPDFGVPVELFHGIIPGDSHPAMNLNGLR